MDLFPETKGQQPEPVKYSSQGVQDQWGYERAFVRLVPRWDEATGLWLVGWVAKADGALDEWIAGRAPLPRHPWYRPDDQPQGKSLDVGLAIAARAVKIVLEQFKQYIEIELHPVVTELQEQLEVDARRWLVGA